MPKRKIIDLRTLEPLDTEHDEHLGGFAPTSCFTPYFPDNSSIPREVEARVAREFEEGLSKI